MAMKHKKIFPILALMLIFPIARASSFADPGAWKLKKMEDGIEVFLRDVPERNLKEFKGIMYVRGIRLSSMVAAFDDTTSYTGWMHNCTESKLLKKMNIHERITYTVTHAPWPARDRDTIVHSYMSQDPESLAVTIAITSRADYMPRNGKLVRIPYMKALWTFKPTMSGDVMISYQTVTDPGGYLPLWMMNLSVIDLPYYTMAKFRNAIKDKKYMAAVYEVIQEPETD